MGEVRCLFIFPVILLGVDTVELSHAFREISFRCFYNKMVMEEGLFASMKAIKLNS